MFKKILVAAAFSTTAISPAFGDSDNQNPVETEMSQVISKMNEAMLPGPASVDLAGQAKLVLGNDYVFVPRKEANDYMKAAGNGDHPNMVGLVLGKTDTGQWMLAIEYVDDGYIREDDAKTWNADDLLKSLTEGTEEANVERKKAGHDTFHVVGWIDKPAYDQAKHKLIWSMEAKVDGLPPSDVPGYDRIVNHKTYAFGRLGYLSLTLMTDKADIETSKIHATNILNAVHFEEGKRYEDFVEGTDRVAEYGLAALVVGVVAKKLGFLAMLGVFLVKAWKLIALGSVVLLAAIRRLFGKKESDV